MRTGLVLSSGLCLRARPFENPNPRSWIKYLGLFWVSVLALAASLLARGPSVRKRQPTRQINPDTHCSRPTPPPYTHTNTLLVPCPSVHPRTTLTPPHPPRTRPRPSSSSPTGSRRPTSGPACPTTRRPPSEAGSSSSPNGPNEFAMLSGVWAFQVAGARAGERAQRPTLVPGSHLIKGGRNHNCIGKLETRASCSILQRTRGCCL